MTEDFPISDRVDKSKRIVIPIFLLFFAIGIYEAIAVVNEFEMDEIILHNFFLLILILSILMSTYWILLTDDFWLIYEGSDETISTKLITGLKFILWTGGMFLCFFLISKSIFSICNRTIGGQNQINISGKVIRKVQNRNRCYFEISDLNLKRNIEIKVGHSDYESFNVGNTFETTKSIGYFGLIYEKR